MLTPLVTFAEAHKDSPALITNVVSVDFVVFSESNTSPNILLAADGVCPTGTR